MVWAVANAGTVILLSGEALVGVSSEVKERCGEDRDTMDYIAFRWPQYIPRIGLELDRRQTVLWADVQEEHTASEPGTTQAEHDDAEAK